MGQVVPADFLGFIETPLPNMAHETVLMEGAAVSHHDELMANFFAQASLQPYVPACIRASLQPHMPAPCASRLQPSVLAAALQCVPYVCPTCALSVP